MRKIDLYWRSNPEWLEWNGEKYLLKNDAPREAKESYQNYRRQLADGGSEFFRFLRQAYRDRLCMTPGCTTCYCMPFRKRVQDIGAETMRKWLLEVTREEIFSTSLRWYDPVTVILVALPELHGLDCPLFEIRHEIYERKCARFQEIREARKREVEKRVKEEQLRAERRRQQAENHRLASDAKRKEHTALAERFATLTLQEQLIILSNDSKHNPHFFPINYGAVQMCDLVKLPCDALERLSRKFSQYSKKPWRAFYRKVCAAQVEFVHAPLFHAVDTLDFYRTKELLRRGADPNIRIPRDGLAELAGGKTLMDLLEGHLMGGADRQTILDLAQLLWVYGLRDWDGDSILLDPNKGVIGAHPVQLP